MEPEDRKIFEFSLLELDWIEYSSSIFHGLKKHIVKEDPNETTFESDDHMIRKC